jgi:hypothetical protein
LLHHRLLKERLLVNGLTHLRTIVDERFICHILNLFNFNRNE